MRTRRTKNNNPPSRRTSSIGVRMPLVATIATTMLSTSHAFTFQSLSPIQTIPKMFNDVRLYSTTSDEQQQQQQEIMAQSSSTTEQEQVGGGGGGRIERYVMVKRNKQSMAFRNGSPLVFSGAVESTYHHDFDEFSMALGDESQSSVPIGALVGVMVNRDKATGDRGGGGRGGGNRRRGGGRGGNRNDKNQSSDKKKSSPESKHYYMNSSNGDIQIHNSENAQKEEEMVVVDELKFKLSQSNLIGYGVYNPSSMYRVRILCHQAVHPTLFKQVKNMLKGQTEETNASSSPDERAIEMILQMKLQEAIYARKALNLPSPMTDSYRLVNGEGDGLSGLAIDILGAKVAVIMSSAAWCELYKPTIQRVVEFVLRSEFPSYFESDETMNLVWRNTPSRLLQDGLENVTQDDNKDENDDTKKTDPVVIMENSVKYYTNPFDLNSQKTGFYCDQRENRFNLAQYCQGKRVLDLCCYNGGFALNAMVHGNAKSCIGVDSSQDAIDAAIENAVLNGLTYGSGENVEFVRDDISNFMKKAADDGEKFDVIILDPPKLAPSVAGLERAARKYHSLNRDAIKLINEKEGGLILSCSCSGAMTQKRQLFLETVKGAALSAQRQITLLKCDGAASCHTQCPASFPAGVYLTAALFYVSPKIDN